MQSGAIGVVAACGVIIVIEQRAKMACGVGYGIASAVIGNSKVEQLLKSIPCCQIAYHPLFVAGLGAGSGGYSFECGIYGRAAWLQKPDGEGACRILPSPLTVWDFPLSFIFLNGVKPGLDVREYAVNFSRAGNRMVLTLFLVVVAQRGGLGVVYVEASGYCIEIVIAASRHLSAFQQSVDEFFVIDFQPYYGMDLQDCAGKSIEYHSFFGFRSIVKYMLQHFYHQVVRYKLSLGYVAVGNFAEFGTAGDVVA